MAELELVFAWGKRKEPVPGKGMSMQKEERQQLEGERKANWSCCHGYPLAVASDVIQRAWGRSMAGTRTTVAGAIVVWPRRVGNHAG